MTYHPPKELSFILAEEGIQHSPSYYCAIRRYGSVIGDTPFVGQYARPKEIKEWLQRHPEFRRDFDKDEIQKNSAGIDVL